jgi:hypothetical protein
MSDGQQAVWGSHWYHWPDRVKHHAAIEEIKQALPQVHVCDEPDVMSSQAAYVRELEAMLMQGLKDAPADVPIIANIEHCWPLRDDGSPNHADVDGALAMAAMLAPVLRRWRQVGGHRLHAYGAYGLHVADTWGFAASGFGTFERNRAVASVLAGLVDVVDLDGYFTSSGRAPFAPLTIDKSPLIWMQRRVYQDATAARLMWGKALRVWTGPGIIGHPQDGEVDGWVLDEHLKWCLRLAETGLINSAVHFGGWANKARKGMAFDLGQRRLIERATAVVQQAEQKKNTRQAQSMASRT